ncbi:hypothetical protein BDZ45DRAFT_257520 [Acephala macrosclerotiorum]|nr:hypothetical protein BDZ45DRAFT_257520 [Acephala macrosclerotiorum]
MEISSNYMHRARKPENRKRKGDDDDDEEEKPAPKRITKTDRKKGVKATTKNTEKIIKKEQSSKTKKEDTKQALVELTLGDIDSYWQFGMSGQKTIDLDWLVNDLTPVSSTQDSDGFFDGLTERAAPCLQVILPYIPDDDEMRGQVPYEEQKDCDDAPMSPTHSHHTRSRGLTDKWEALSSRGEHNNYLSLSLIEQVVGYGVGVDLLNGRLCICTILCNAPPIKYT